MRLERADELGELLSNSLTIRRLAAKVPSVL